ncbi:MAG: hypothetical protein ACE5DL_01820 [Nitrosopumilaceae archaeon]
MSKTNFKKFQKLSIVILGTFAIFTYSNLAYGSISEGCGLWDLTLECDLSGWMKLLLGDLAIGAFLAILLHYFAQKNGKLLESIIKEQEIMRTKRRKFAVVSLKNDFTALIFIYSVIDTLISQYNQMESEKQDKRKQISRDEEKLVRTIGIIRDTVLFASDVLKPEIVNEVNELCKLASDTMPTDEKGKLSLPNYSRLKTWIFDLSNVLTDLGKLDNDLEKQLMK